MTRARKRFTLAALVVALPLFLAASVVPLVAGFVALHRMPGETASTTGIVTTAGHCGGRSSTDGTAIFTVGGATYTASVPCNVAKGHRAPVKYDPADPGHNNDSGSNAGIYFVMSGVFFLALSGLLCSLIGVARAPVLPAAPRRRRGAGDIPRSAEKPRHLAP